MNFFLIFLYDSKIKQYCTSKLADFPKYQHIYGCDVDFYFICIYFFTVKLQFNKQLNVS